MDGRLTRCGEGGPFGVGPQQVDLKERLCGYRGCAGLQLISWLTSYLRGSMATVRGLLRTLKLVGYFIRYGSELVVRRPATRAARAEWLHRFCAAAMRGFEIPIAVDGAFPKRGALVTNHTGYLDIIALAATQPCVFVSKAEIQKWPVVGWLATMAGTVFVERGRGGSALRAKEGLQAASDAGIPVVFFPEGTTTNGRTLLPFHAGLLAQVLDAGQPVTAGFLHYSLNETNGAGVTVEDEVAYWGDVNLLKHIVGLMGLRGVHVHVRIAPAPIAFASDTQHRKVSAVEARNAVLGLATVRLEEPVGKTEREPVEA
jgi:1-acyl-sn-glycerol-3-phosphate acyltransferase